LFDFFVYAMVNGLNTKGVSAMPFEIAQRMRNVIAQLIPPEFSQKNLPGERQAESGQELPGEQQAEFGQDLPGERQARATLEEIEGDPDLALLKGAQDTRKGSAIRSRRHCSTAVTISWTRRGCGCSAFRSSV
jgi:hypothetical protein